MVSHSLRHCGIARAPATVRRAREGQLAPFQPALTTGTGCGRSRHCRLPWNAPGARQKAQVGAWKESSLLMGSHSITGIELLASHHQSAVGTMLQRGAS